MVVDIKMSREPGQPFGFRLIGGRDFEIPLTVSRVVEDGIAHRAGMQEGDVVVRINDNPTIDMTHENAHDELVAAGNDFILGVLRATNLLADGNAGDAMEQQDTTVAEDSELKMEQERIDKIIPDKPVTDEEIAELLSGEAEVLKSHGVLGVNFNRMMPKAGVFKRSEVFQVLNDQQLKTKEDENDENQRWTTFLQKPNRPAPSPRNHSTFTNTYKPVIVKQPKPKCAPDYRKTPSPEPVQVQVQESNEIVNNEIIDEKREEEGEVTEIIQVQEQHFTTEFSSETIVTTTTTTMSTETTEAVTFEELAADATGEPVNDDLIAEEIKSQEDEVSIVSSAFAEQLENVQHQLMALSHLPKTIQSTLDEITKQLQSLIPTSKLNKQKSAEPENTSTAEENTKTDEETKETSEQSDQTIIESTINTVESTTIQETVEVEIVNQEQQSVQQEQKNQEAEMEHHPTKDEIEEYEESQKKFRELWEKKREKEPVDAKTELTAELKQKVTEERAIKQKRAKNFRGLQPQERPIILPGGRKWKNAKDAMNDQLIAEIISSQAELIMGTTLGHQYESPVLNFDERVNFLKYQKPEKDLSFLKNSETYRTIHHMTPHENGIEKRPAMVAAEEDVLKCASPNPLNQNSS